MIIKGNHNSQLPTLNSQFSNSQLSIFYYTIGSDMP